MLYTRKGDGGTSGLFGTKERFSKDSSIYRALGSIDELNSLIGICRSISKDEKSELNISSLLFEIQEKLFIIQAELAGAPKTLKQTDLGDLEKHIEKIEKTVINPHSFVVSGETRMSAFFDFSRSVSRRAEREVFAARDFKRLSSNTYAYINRLSSFFFSLARFTAQKNNVKEFAPSYRELPVADEINYE